MTLRTNCWSGPRNVSTALMYGFRQRSDTRVVDEPLYGHYLATTGARHPAHDELLTSLETDAEAVIERTILGPCDRPVLFMKQMAHHLTPEVDRGFLDRCRNVLLIRDPAEVLASLVNQVPEPTMRDVGLEHQVSILHARLEAGEDVPVVDARELLRDPEVVLRRLCQRLDLAWDPSMLAWPPGPKPEDGPWAPHWYANVHRSTGFAPYRPSTAPVPEHCLELLGRCRPLYDELTDHAIPARS